MLTRRLKNKRLNNCGKMVVNLRKIISTQSQKLGYFMITKQLSSSLIDINLYLFEQVGKNGDRHKPKKTQFFLTCLVFQQNITCVEQ